jgi:hypothetical protein
VNRYARGDTDAGFWATSPSDITLTKEKSTSFLSKKYRFFTSEWPNEETATTAEAGR